MLDELEKLLKKQGESFDEFKSSMDEQLKSKLNADDPVIADRLGKIETSLDGYVEAKAAIDTAIASEKKEREDLEARINRLGITATKEED